jgi:hypothetical protein
MRSAIVAHSATAAFTAFLVGVGIWGIRETRHALELTQRAWVIPMGAQLYLPLERDKPVHFGVLTINTGREPAQDVNLRVENSTIDSHNPVTSSISNVKITDDRPVCEGVHPEKSRQVFTPSLTNLGYYNSVDSSYGDPPFLVDNRVLNGEKFYVVRGCFAYVTYDVPRHATFCYILMSGPAASTAVVQLGQNPPPATVATTQQGQNQNQPNAANLPFVACGSGFENT